MVSSQGRKFALTHTHLIAHSLSRRMEGRIAWNIQRLCRGRKDEYEKHPSLGQLELIERVIALSEQSFSAGPFGQGSPTWCK